MCWRIEDLVVDNTAAGVDRGLWEGWWDKNRAVYDTSRLWMGKKGVLRILEGSGPCPRDEDLKIYIAWIE